MRLFKKDTTNDYVLPKYYKAANSVKDHQHEYEITPPKTKKSIRNL